VKIVNSKSKDEALDAFAAGQRAAERGLTERDKAQREALAANEERLDRWLTPPGKAAGASAPLPRRDGAGR
jgi:hypothetical protein